MKKTVEIYLSNQPSYRTKVGNVTYIVHAGPPPGSEDENTPEIHIDDENSARGGQAEEKSGKSKEPNEPKIYKSSRDVSIPYADKEITPPDDGTRKPPGKSWPRERGEIDSGKGRGFGKETSHWSRGL